MPDVFKSVHRKYNLSPGDFPDLKKFKTVAEELDFSDFPMMTGKRLQNGKLMRQLDEVIQNDIPHLMESLPGMSNPGGLSQNAE